MRGGDFYDTYGNLTYFADTTGLTDKTRTGVDKQVNVKAHTASRFMRDPAPYQVSATVYERSYGNGRNKGCRTPSQQTKLARRGHVFNLSALSDVRSSRFLGRHKPNGLWSRNEKGRFPGVVSLAGKNRPKRLTR